MTHDPHGNPGASREPSAGPPGPRRPHGLRLLLRLTLLSFAANVLDSVVQSLTTPGTTLGLEGLTAVPGLSSTVLVVEVVLTAALYALVWLPLRGQLQWGWVLGLVFCSLAVLGGAFDLPVLVLDGHLLAALSTLVLVAVNVLWLVTACRSDVRTALR